MYCNELNLISVGEHYEEEIELPENFFSKSWVYNEVFPKSKSDGICFKIHSTNSPKKGFLKTDYYIGLDHIGNTGTSIYISPKLNSYDNKKSYEVDYLKMLFESVQNPELYEDIDELFIIKWDKPEIKIKHQNDILTPFLVIQFLGVLKSIVKKGLKKSYYKVEQNLNSRVRGKILIGKTIKQNHFKNKLLDTICSYEEFGFNGIENRFLKKTLTFIKPYLDSHSKILSGNNLLDTYNFINPSFSSVSSRFHYNELKKVKSNTFYKEYSKAINLAQKILKRFGNNITANSSEIEIRKTPPFWIDMSKLFEIYVLGLLRKDYGQSVKFQEAALGGNELDFVIGKGNNTIICDTKYKPWFKFDWNEKMNSDLRQISGYARLKDIRNKFEIDDNVVPECLIVYPDLEKEVHGRIDLTQKVECKNYLNINKLGIGLPILSKKSNS